MAGGENGDPNSFIGLWYAMLMLGAAMLAKNAVEKGLSVAPYIKTSLSPGSGVADLYLKGSGLLQYLEKLGFYTSGCKKPL